MPPQPPRPVKAGKGGERNKGLHPRNVHRRGYDFDALMAACPSLRSHVRPTPYGKLSIDFGDPLAVKALNAALLWCEYQIQDWDIPEGFLCPPIPGRVDYLHYVADLLAEGGKVPRGRKISVLDIGTGANGIYPILGIQSYGWQFVGTDIDPRSLANVTDIIARNPCLAGRLDLRLQPDERAIFDGILEPEESFDLSICNPPFHASQAEASEGSLRKQVNLAVNRGERQQGKAAGSPALNFGGQGAELWCEGGERQFLARMIAQSQQFSTQVLWFSTLVSKSDNLKPCYQALAQAGADTVKTIEMHQGQKITRVLAWTFFPKPQRTLWRQLR
jgi:23S rRNA (adenine1618-N6)-methyltransferase